MLDGDFLYNAIKDEEVLMVGYEVKSVWANGKITDKQKIIVRCFVVNVNSSPIDIRIALPMDKSYFRILRNGIGRNIGRLSDVIGPIDTRGVYNYQGALKTSYIGISTDFFGVQQDDEIEI